MIVKSSRIFVWSSSRYSRYLVSRICGISLQCVTATSQAPYTQQPGPAGHQAPVTLYILWSSQFLLRELYRGMLSINYYEIQRALCEKLWHSFCCISFVLTHSRHVGFLPWPDTIDFLWGFFAFYIQLTVPLFGIAGELVTLSFICLGQTFRNFKFRIRNLCVLWGYCHYDSKWRL